MEKARALAMIDTMARMQDSHNRHVHPEWLNQGYEYYRAVWVECAELLDHFGWKWWKKQDPDLDQVKLEIVDIWHFGLSDLIRAQALQDAVPQLLSVSAQAKPDAEAFRLAVESLAEITLARRTFAMEPFAAVLEARGEHDQPEVISGVLCHGSPSPRGSTAGASPQQRVRAGNASPKPSTETIPGDTTMPAPIPRGPW